MTHTAKTLFEDYKEYCEACDSPCSFYNWLTDDIDNSYTGKEALNIIDELTESFLDDLHLVREHHRN